MKRENKEVKEFIENYAINTFKKCDLFTRTFGKNFVENRLKLNLDMVYTDEFNLYQNGYYSCINKCITLCSKKHNEHLTKEDIEKNESIISTAMHEVIHATLNRTKTECELKQIANGSGIYEFYENGNELGRGLNEGLTNWICKKAGVEIFSYPLLTNFVDILEVAIGEDNVIKLGKGNIRKNVTKLLSMNIKQCSTFLSTIDEIELMNRDITKIDEILDVLKVYNIKDKAPKEMQRNINREYMELKDDSIYSKEFEEYKVLLQESSLEQTTDLELLYFQKLMENKVKMLKNNIGYINNTIYNKYFKEEFDILCQTVSKQTKNIPIKKLKKFDKLYELMCKSDFLGVENFKENYDILNENLSYNKQETVTNRYVNNKIQTINERE